MSRPEIPIDWKLVDRLLIAGCSGVEIAANFAMHPKTFYERVLDKYSVNFTEYCQEKRSKGDAFLREAQYNNAIRGNTTMQVWLGKVRLGQKEPESENQANKALIQELLQMAKERVNDLTKDKDQSTGQDIPQDGISSGYLPDIKGESGT
jgi:hypothetical protein